jgi:hypothetical protein
MTLYQPFYCEENIWQLARLRHGAAGIAQQAVVLVTNPARTVACWHQRASRAPDAPVVWDYHVVLVERDENGTTVIHDLDSTVGTPLPAAAWIAATFPQCDHVRPTYRPGFRLVAATTWLRDFATDRSHMHDAAGHWFQPPPPWDPPGAPRHNLFDWLVAGETATAPGIWMDLKAFTELVHGGPWPDADRGLTAR